MKGLLYLSAFVCFILNFITLSAFANYETDIGDSSYSSSSYSSGGDFGLGLASSSMMLATDETALTGIYELSRKSFIQGYFVMTSSDPNSYGLGASFKYTASGDNDAGLHIGGGLGLGQTTQERSFLRINGILGVHFSVNRKVAIHVDGGLTITQDESANDDTDSQIMIGGHSSIYGLSIVYKL